MHNILKNNQLVSDDIGNYKIGLTHVLLQNAEVTDAIANTLEWTEDKVINIDIKMNGVTVPAIVLEEVLQDWFKGLENTFKNRYENPENEIKERVEQKLQEIVEEKVEVFIEKLREATNTLDSMKYLCKLEDWEKM